ncbi:hypothetical protein CVT24_011007 [Panaeolus cyanescens]|uniref:Uncharacterized protein n=1 Tax=Panaeolus cyanescens TaxID=181874 RepID=A0A409YV88_9AGAR|nr:hypothetical protein CVT24_011007 [Panaeolus cyanescens]
MPRNRRRLPLAEFFHQYRDEGFFYDRTQSAPDEFERLCEFLEFPDDLDERRELYEYREARREYNAALTNQFNHIYGTRVDRYDAWHDLCSRVGVIDIPDTIRGCKAIIRETHVNLVDLTEAISNDSTVETFDTEYELREYTIETRKIFPRANIHSGDLLRFLLRKIFSL